MAVWFQIPSQPCIPAASNNSVAGAQIYEVGAIVAALDLGTEITYDNRFSKILQL
jgi:hypothetical protein